MGTADQLKSAGEQNTTDGVFEVPSVSRRCKPAALTKEGLAFRAYHTLTCQNQQEICRCQSQESKRGRGKQEVSWMKVAAQAHPYLQLIQFGSLKSTKLYYAYILYGDYARELMQM